MSKDNMFDLSKRGPVTTKESTEITQEEKEQLLKGYIQIPYEQWSNIRKYWHIRYEREGGLFRRGGFVNSIWQKTDKDGKTKKYLQLVTNPHKKPDKTTNPYWTIQLDTLSKIWRRITNKEKSPESPQAIEELKTKVEQLRKEVAWLKALVSKLHGLNIQQS